MNSNAVKSGIVSIGALGAIVLVSPMSAIAQGEASPQAPLSSELEATLASCASCHGADGMGISQVAPRLAGQDAGYLSEQLGYFATGIRGADPDDVMGQLMVEWVAGLSPEDMHAIAVHYESMAAPIDGLPESSALTDQQEQGKVVFDNNCKSCHSGKAKGAGTLGVPYLGFLEGAYIGRQLLGYQMDWRGGQGSSTRALNMKQMAYQLRSEEEEQALIAYLSAGEED